ncbi:T9SS type A sorting domain-containing protein, partial [candidate division KSB1 bacterium]|nr:T9SS type A sorting domain-containing protein [candidate division KSB1 bacterium]
DVTARFSVDVNGALDWYNKKPFADVKSVWVTGDWNNWGGSWGVADTSVLIRMYDNGSNGDAVAGDGIWTTEVKFAAGTMSAKLYKYSIYGTGVDTLNKGQSVMDNEAGMAMNHTLLIDDTNPLYVLPLDKFGSQWNTAIERISTTTIPEAFVLSQNYPNPFNPMTEIVYSLPKDVAVTLSIYNTLGHKIATLVNEKQNAGVYRVSWYGQDDLGRSMATGVYFYHLRAGDFSQTMKMLFVK